MSETVLTLFGDHELILSLLIGWLVYTVLYWLFLCWNRLLRSINIRKNGWPPPHCDADGDAVVPDAEVEIVKAANHKPPQNDELSEMPKA